MSDELVELLRGDFGIGAPYGVLEAAADKLEALEAELAMAKRSAEASHLAASQHWAELAAERAANVKNAQTFSALAAEYRARVALERALADQAIEALRLVRTSLPSVSTPQHKRDAMDAALAAHRAARTPQEKP